MVATKAGPTMGVGDAVIVPTGVGDAAGGAVQFDGVTVSNCQPLPRAEMEQLLVSKLQIAPGTYLCGKNQIAACVGNIRNRFGLHCNIAI
jgi:hypothetical protein